MRAPGAFVLPRDVVIGRVGELPSERRAGLDADHYYLSRPGSRTPTHVVDPDTLRVLRRFDGPSSIVDAVIAYAGESRSDPHRLLEAVYPALEALANARLLVPAKASDAGAPEPLLAPGDALAGCVLRACVHVTRDTELHYAVGDSGQPVALKLQRTPGGGQVVRELSVLRRATGFPFPTAVTDGELDGRPYVVTGWVFGGDLTTVAAELDTGRTGAVRRLELIRAVSRAYAALHRAGVLHGDVHPGNLVGDATRGITIVDYGFARAVATRSPKAMRGGAPQYFEPEYARARLGHREIPPVTPLGEQYAVAAVAYQVATGTAYAVFPLDRDRWLRTIAEAPPRPFADAGVEPWPTLEAVLGRALAKDPAERYANVDELADALAQVEPPARFGKSAREREHLPSELRSACVDRAFVAAPELTAPPTASIAFGAAGLGVAALRLAQLADDPEAMRAAEVWAALARRAIGTENAFTDPAIGLAPATVSPASFYHGPCGVDWLEALLARARGDYLAFTDAVEAFCRRLDAVDEPSLDFWLGDSGTLVGASLLLESAPASAAVARGRLLAAGGRLEGSLRRVYRADPGSLSGYRGIAHGGAGVLYALLLWRKSAGSPVPRELVPHLERLASDARPERGGLAWAPVDGESDAPPQAGWCHGVAGFVHLWLLAEELLGGYAELAEGAGWAAWSHPDRKVDLCCGLAGRGYALLRLAEWSGNVGWVIRAQQLAERAARPAAAAAARQLSLYKSSVGTELLLADLRQPEWAAMPAFALGCW